METITTNGSKHSVVGATDTDIRLEGGDKLNNYVSQHLTFIYSLERGQSL